MTKQSGWCACCTGTNQLRVTINFKQREKKTKLLVEQNKFSELFTDCLNDVLV